MFIQKLNQLLIACLECGIKLRSDRALTPYCMDFGSNRRLLHSVSSSSIRPLSLGVESEIIVSMNAYNPAAAMLLTDWIESK